jgi:hypothetical protein
MSGIGINDSYKKMEALGKTLENNISNVALLRAILADNLKTAAPAGELGRTFAQGLLDSCQANPETSGGGTPKSHSMSEIQ